MKALGWVLVVLGGLIMLYPSQSWFSLGFFEYSFVPIVGFVINLLGAWFIGRKPKVTAIVAPTGVI